MVDEAAPSIFGMRQRIDEIDLAIIRLWRERAELSKQIGTMRVAAGGTRLILSRENEILKRFREGIGVEGTELALLILKAGRGRFGSDLPERAGGRPPRPDSRERAISD